MKKNLLLLVFGLFLSLNFATAQGKKIGNQTIEIKTSAQCEMCQERIEKAASAQKGVKSAKLNMETKMVAVTYNSKATTPDKIRDAITMAGYEADEKKANVTAYKKLPGCCKKQN